MIMSWGVDLWDQWECVSTHTHKGIGFLENYSHFVKDRCQIEVDYARSLRKLVKQYLPKKKDDDELHCQANQQDWSKRKSWGSLKRRSKPCLGNDGYTFVKAFRNAVSETADLAGQHEVISENLSAHVLQDINTLLRELKEERKRHLSDGAALQQKLTNSLSLLEKAKKNYEKSFREAEKALENYTKADADLNLSRAEVEKQRMNSSIKDQQCEDCKNEYANQLQKTNLLQGNHYSTTMPGIFQSLQELDEKRILSFKQLLKKSVEIERNVFPIINKCLDGIVDAANSINEKNDSLIVIERYKSGFTPPGDVPFDDLSTPRQNGNSVSVVHTPDRPHTIKGTLSASKFKKRGGILGIFGANKNNISFSEKEDFRELPPNQRKKKIQQKIDEVSNKLNQETAARDGLLKMKEVYESNASLGDPMTITGQLNDSCTKIEKLKAELDRFQAMIDESETDGHSGNISVTGPSTPSASSLGRHTSSAAVMTHHNGGGTSSPRSSLASHRTSLSDESLSRSASDSSVCTNPSQTASTTTTTPSSSSPPSGQTNRTSLTSTTSSITSGPVLTTIAAPPRCSPPTNTSTPLPPTQGSSHSPESGIGLSRNSLHGSDSYDQQDEENENTEEFYDIEPLPIIGYCNAIYMFEGQSEGSMNMAVGETLDVIELDQGDGWTRVRRRNEAFEEGFVPTSYIEIKLQNDC